MNGSGGKRREIIIETERVILISKHSSSTHKWCERCQQALPLLTMEEAAAVMRLTAEEILRRIEKEEIHFIETPTRGLRICPCSLIKER